MKNKISFSNLGEKKSKNRIEEESKTLNGKLKQGIVGSENHLFFENDIVSRYVPTRKAASFLGISENALRIRVYRGEIKPYRLGRRLRFKISDLLELFQEGRD